MTREKVIYSIERCICHVPDVCRDCAYDAGHPFNECVEMLMKDVLELLKAYEYARCGNCQFRDFGENEVDSWDRCKLHRHNTSPDEYCSWFVERAGEVGCG